MNQEKKCPRTWGSHWGLLVLPVAPPDVVPNCAPAVVALALLFSGVQLMLARNFRAGSLIVGAALCLILTAGVTGR